MPKTFKQLTEDLDDRKNSYDGDKKNATGRKDVDDTKPLKKKVGGRQRSDDEESFADAHRVKDTPSPLNADPTLNARNMNQTDKHDNKVPGERDRPRQGSSPKEKPRESSGMLSGLSRTSPRRGDRLDNGDSSSSPLRISPTAVNPAKQNGINEASVYDSLKKIIENKKARSLVFDDGDTALITPVTASKLLAIESRLHGANRNTFSKRVNASPASMLAVLNLR